MSNKIIVRYLAVIFLASFTCCLSSIVPLDQNQTEIITLIEDIQSDMINNQLLLNTEYRKKIEDCNKKFEDCNKKFDNNSLFLLQACGPEYNEDHLRKDKETFSSKLKIYNTVFRYLHPIISDQEISVSLQKCHTELNEYKNNLDAQTINSNKENEFCLLKDKHTTLCENKNALIDQGLLIIEYLTTSIDNIGNSFDRKNSKKTFNKSLENIQKAYTATNHFFEQFKKDIALDSQDSHQQIEKNNEEINKKKLEIQEFKSELEKFFESRAQTSYFDSISPFRKIMGIVSCACMLTFVLLYTKSFLSSANSL